MEAHTRDTRATVGADPRQMAEAQEIESGIRQLCRLRAKVAPRLDTVARVRLLRLMDLDLRGV